jgi:hypothetical protein
MKYQKASSTLVTGSGTGPALSIYVGSGSAILAVDIYGTGMSQNS